MHEMSLCESILCIVEEHAAKHSYRKVTAVWLEVGALSGVEVAALRFGFDVVMKESIAEDARLEIVNVPGQALCLQCMNKVEISQRFDTCPFCGANRLQINAGEELQVKELEVE